MWTCLNAVLSKTRGQTESCSQLDRPGAVDLKNLLCVRRQPRTEFSLKTKYAKRFLSVVNYWQPISFWEQQPFRQFIDLSNVDSKSIYNLPEKNLLPLPRLLGPYYYYYYYHHHHHYRHYFRPNFFTRPIFLQLLQVKPETLYRCSAATEFRYSGRFYFTVFRSLSTKPKVKELLKLVHISQSYRKNISGTFYGPWCILHLNSCLASPANVRSAVFPFLLPYSSLKQSSGTASTAPEIISNRTVTGQFAVKWFGLTEVM